MSLVGSRASLGKDASQCDVGHSRCWRGSNVPQQHGDGAPASVGKMWCGHAAPRSVLVIFSALHLSGWRPCRWPYALMRLTWNQQSWNYSLKMWGKKKIISEKDEIAENS